MICHMSLQICPKEVFFVTFRSARHIFSLSFFCIFFCPFYFSFFAGWNLNRSRFACKQNPSIRTSKIRPYERSNTDFACQYPVKFVYILITVLVSIQLNLFTYSLPY